MSAPGPPPSDNPPPKSESTEPDRANRETSPPAPLFQAGQAVPFRPAWTLVKELGRGGFGEVWQAKHEWRKDLSAVKFCTHPEARVQLVAHEKKVIVRVMKYAGDHPHIVPLLDYDLSGEIPWLMYEYVEGGTLVDAIVAWRDYPLPKRMGRAVLALYGLSRALKRVHRLDPPIVHRDLKPANILMAKGVPKITDFGIGGAAATAKLHESGRQAEISIMLPKMLESMGTLRYASPEQMFGSPPNPRDDVYALGIIAFQMLVGDLKSAPHTDAADILRGLRVPPELIALIVKSVAMDPMRRPESARDWERTLRQWMPKKPKPGQSGVVNLTGSSPVLVPLGPVPTSGGSSSAFVPVSGPADPQPLTANAPHPTTSAPSATAPPVTASPVVPTDEPPQGPLVLSVPGAFLTRPADEPETTWKEVAKTPAEIAFEPGLVYCIRVKETATDRDLEGLTALTRHDALVAVNLAWCEQVTDVGLVHLKELRSLQNLDLMGCKRITNLGTVNFAKMSALQNLNLRWCALLTDIGLQVMRRPEALQTLDLMGVSQLTDVGLNHLRVLTNLRHLNVRWCEQITDAGLKHLERLTNLRYLNLWNCSRITDAGVAAFKAAVPECHIER